MLKGYLHISTSANKNLIGIKVSLYLKPNILIKRQRENTISTPAKDSKNSIIETDIGKLSLIIDKMKIPRFTITFGNSFISIFSKTI